MKVLTNNDIIEKEVNWINEKIDSAAKPNWLSSVIPDNYAHYFKLNFPIGFKDEKTDKAYQTSFRDLAQMAGMEFDEKFCFVSLPTHIKMQIVSLPKEEKKFIKILQTILALDTKCIFYGFGDDVAPDKYMSEWIIKGRINDLPILVDELNEHAENGIENFPNYIFPLNRHWCVGNIIHQSGTLLLGCRDLLADRIRNQTKIEYVELNANSEYIEFRRRK